MNAKRVALYVRRSTDRQEDSHETQLKLLEDESGRRGWNVVGRYRDSISGSSELGERPAFRQLLGAIKRGEVDVVFVVRFDRFSRAGAVGMISAVEELADLGVDVVSLREPTLSVEGPQGKLLLTIMAAVAEFERSLTIERIREGIDRARAAGKTLGRPQKQIDVERVNSLRKEGLSIRKIAEELGVPKSTLYPVVKKIETNGV